MVMASAMTTADVDLVDADTAYVTIPAPRMEAAAAIVDRVAGALDRVDVRGMTTHSFYFFKIENLLSAKSRYAMGVKYETK